MPAHLRIEQRNPPHRKLRLYRQRLPGREGPPAERAGRIHGHPVVRGRGRLGHGAYRQRKDPGAKRLPQPQRRRSPDLRAGGRLFEKPADLARLHPGAFQRGSHRGQDGRLAFHAGGRDPGHAKLSGRPQLQPDFRGERAAFPGRGPEQVHLRYRNLRGLIDHRQFPERDHRLQRRGGLGKLRHLGIRIRHQAPVHGGCGSRRTPSPASWTRSTWPWAPAACRTPTPA